MKESYREDLASSSGLELYADDGNVVGVATAEVYAGHQPTLERSANAYEVILHVRICAGDGQQWPFLPRPFYSGFATLKPLTKPSFFAAMQVCSS